MARANSTHQPQRLRDKPRAHVRPQPQRGAATGATTDEPVVLDDLPALIPVTGSELEVIEVYLGTLIDGLLGGAKPASAAKPILSVNPGKPIRASRPRS